MSGNAPNKTMCVNSGKMTPVICFMHIFNMFSKCMNIAFCLPYLGVSKKHIEFTKEKSENIPF